MADRVPPPGSAVWVLGLVLVATAGFVDVTGFLTISGVYSANMSGNSVGMSIALIQQSRWSALKKFCPTVVFIPGLIAGALIVEVAKRRKWRYLVAPPVAVEAVCLLAFVGVAHRALAWAHQHRAVPWSLQLWLIALAAGAMGLQNGSLRRVGGLELVHTYVTGTLLAFAENLVDAILWLTRTVAMGPGHRLEQLLRDTGGRRSLRLALYSLWIWIFYIVGALGAAMAEKSWHGRAMRIPIATLLLIAAIDLVHPICAGAKD